jgi:uncharacterized protein YodC (DUF2158 family)
MSSKNLKIGDTVRLSSGHRLITIIDIFWDEETVLCQWFDEKTEEFDPFIVPIETIVLDSGERAADNNQKNN